MHELACPSCNAPSQYDLKDYLLLCPFCSVTFRLHLDSGKKEMYSDHYIVANSCDSRQVKALVIEWLKRLHHSAEAAEREYFVTDINGYSIPFWIVSLEAHTSWKGLVRRFKHSTLDQSPGANFIMESGQFRRNYRWAISARTNICENWGVTLLHEPKEPITVDWDGFPLDSTFSRGSLDANLGIKKNKEELSAYDVREFFEFKYANGMPILTVQVPEEEALRRAKSQVELYHLALAKLNVDIHIDIRTELEIAGIQLIHLPFWHARYVFRPKSLLKHFHETKEKNVLLEGYAGGVLKGEVALIQKDKFSVNAIVCGVATLFTCFLGAFWHSAFFLVAVFTLIVAAASIFMAQTSKGSSKVRRASVVKRDEETSSEKKTAGPEKAASKGPI